MFYYFFVSITVLSREILDLGVIVPPPESERVLATAKWRVNCEEG